MTPYRDIRASLEARLDKLARRAGAVERDLRRPQQRNAEQRAIEAENDMVLEQLDADGRREIRQIRDALERMDAGTYGRCAACGEQIGKDRLGALPFTAVCIACAEGS